MAIAIGDRLIIVFPTLLFFIGCVFRPIIERPDFKQALKLDKSLADKLVFSFYLLLSIDSLFLFLANGLIIIYLFKLDAIGIITIIVGVILSLSLIISIYSKHYSLFMIGIFGTFGGLGGILALFIFFDNNVIDFYGYVIIVIGAIIGILLGHCIGLLLNPTQNLSLREELFGTDEMPVVRPSEPNVAPRIEGR